MENTGKPKPFKKFLIFTMFIVIASLRVIYSIVVAFLPHHIKTHHTTIQARHIGLMLAYAFQNVF